MEYFPANLTVSNLLQILYPKQRAKCGCISVYFLSSWWYVSPESSEIARPFNFTSLNVFFSNDASLHLNSYTEENRKSTDVFINIRVSVINCASVQKQKLNWYWAMMRDYIWRLLYSDFKHWNNLPQPPPHTHPPHAWSPDDFETWTAAGRRIKTTSGALRHQQINHGVLYFWN